MTDLWDHLAAVAAAVASRYSVGVAPNGEDAMSGIRVLVGTRKGGFILSADGKRNKWTVDGPHFADGRSWALDTMGYSRNAWEPRARDAR